LDLQHGCKFVQILKSKLLENKVASKLMLQKR